MDKIVELWNSLDARHTHTHTKNPIQQYHQNKRTIKIKEEKYNTEDIDFWFSHSIESKVIIDDILGKQICKTFCSVVHRFSNDESNDMYRKRHADKKN